jgi:hypothetical protein
MQEKTKAHVWSSRLFAWIITFMVEVVILLVAKKDSISWIAGIQYALLLIPPIILAIAIRNKSYGPVLSRTTIVFIVATTLDLLQLR